MKDDKIINKVIKKIIGSNKSIYPDSKDVLKELVRDSLDIFFQAFLGGLTVKLTPSEKGS